MAIQYSFYEEYGLVVMTASEYLVAQEIKDYITDFLSKDPRIETGYLELCDIRRIVKNSIAQKDMKDIMRLEEFESRPQPSKLACVVRNDTDFGAVRQYAANDFTANKEIEAFHNISEAKKWLGIEGLKLD